VLVGAGRAAPAQLVGAAVLVEALAQCFKGLVEVARGAGKRGSESNLKVMPSCDLLRFNQN